MTVRVSDLPAGWSDTAIETLLAPLEDGRILHQGWSPQCEKDPSPSDDVWGVLKTTAIQPGTFCPEHNKLLPADLSPRPQLEVKEGDLLITCAGPRARCGVACLVRSTRQRLMISGKMYRFRASTGRIEPRYLEAFIQTQEAQASIDKMKTGTSESGLNLTHDRFRRLMVRVAPLNEQHRMVEEIERQLTRLEAGVAGLKRVQANLKRYRAAVLKVACEGHLVPTEAELARREGRPYEPMSVLLEGIEAEKARAGASPAVVAGSRRSTWHSAVNLTADLRPLPEGWAWVALESVTLKVGDVDHKMPKAVEEGLPYVSSRDFAEYDGIDLRGAKRISKSDFDRLARKIKPEPGDLLLSRYGTVGLVRQIREGQRFLASYSVAVIKTLALPSLNAFLAVALRSETVQSQMRKGVRASAQPDLGLATIRDLQVPLPPHQEQVRIVAEVERCLSLAAALERVVSANLHRAARLRQSVLQAAFSGFLLPRATPPDARPSGEEGG